MKTNSWHRFLVLLAVLSACGGCGPQASSSAPLSEPAPGAAPPEAAAGRFVLTGQLRAIRSQRLTTPQTSSWMVSIRWLAPEGSTVRVGDPVVEFDTSALGAQLKDKRLAVTQAESSLEEKVLGLEAGRLEKRLEVLRLRVARDKARLDAQVPAALQAARDHQEKQLAAERADVALRKGTADLEAFERDAAAQGERLRIELEKAKRDVERVEAALEALTLRAPVDGVLVHGTHPWEGRKWQVGDNCWSGTVVAEVPDLTAMEVEAWLSDVDDGKIAPGLPVRCRLDTHPDKVYTGRIRSIPRVAQPLDRNSSRHFFTVLVELERSDPALMRPGMSVQVEALRGAGAAAAGPGVVQSVRPAGGSELAQGERTHTVRREDLVVSVEASGALRAVDSSAVSPPHLPEVWEYKIGWMAAESSQVKKGQPVLRLDTSELENELERKRAEQDSAEKEHEKKQVDLEMQLGQLEMRQAEAEGSLRRARLKAEGAEGQRGRIEMDKAKLDLELATQEVESLRGRRGFEERSGRIQLETLRQRAERAAQRVAELEQSIAKMTVLAPRDGLLIYRADWRGQKRKIGDSTSAWERILEIPDLSCMEGDAEIDEADAGRVALGQPVRLRLESHPDREYGGRVAHIDPIVQRQSGRSPLKVYRTLLALDATDTERMRPGMRFRAEIEVARRPAALVVPLEAVEAGADGPVVYRREGGRAVRTGVRLGLRNARRVEVLEGLDEGQEVLLP